MLGRTVRGDAESGASCDVQRAHERGEVPTEPVVDPDDPAAEAVPLEHPRESAAGLWREPALRAGTRRIDGARRARDARLRRRLPQQHLLRVAKPGTREGALESDLERIVPERAPRVDAASEQRAVEVDLGLVPELVADAVGLGFVSLR